MAGAVVGTLLFAVVTQIEISSPVANTYLQPRMGILAVVSAVGGPLIGAICGFVGHLLGDYWFQQREVWLSWALAEALVGVGIGFFRQKFDVLGKGFHTRQGLLFEAVQVGANALAWLAVAPLLDMVLYGQRAEKVFLQGAEAFLLNAVITGVLGLLLLAAFSQCYLSFVIPCYCSEKTLPSVVNEIDDTMNQGELQEKYRYEIILVNDASPDQTLSVIESLVKQKENVTGIHFSRNFGQHAALMAGFRYIAEDSDLVVCLDDDGQTPAAEVGKLLQKLEEGYDAVYASYAHKRQSFFRNFGSAVNEKMTRIMLGKPKELQVSSYFAVKRFLVNEMVRYEAAYPYVIGLLLRSTKNIANVPVSHRAREVGRSGYTMKKLLSLWFNGFTNFSIKPLRIATVMGAVLALVGFLYGIFTIIKVLFHLYPGQIPTGWASTISILVFIGGMLMLMIGMVGEYIGRIYMTMNAQPQYVVKEVIRKDTKAEAAEDVPNGGH